MRRLVCLVSVFIAATAPAYGQAPQSESVQGRIFAGINFLATTGSEDLDARVGFEQYLQTGEIRTQQDIGSLGTFDIGGAYGITRRLVVGLSYSRASSSDSATVSGTVPHPQVFNQPRPFETSVGDLSRTEQGVHLFAGWWLPLRPKMDVLLSIGPSIFTVKSAVRFWVTAYLASTPTSLPTSFRTRGDAARSVVRFEVTYGLTSSARERGGASTPTRVANDEVRWT